MSRLDFTTLARADVWPRAVHLTLSILAVGATISCSGASQHVSHDEDVEVTGPPQDDVADNSSESRRGSQFAATSRERIDALVDGEEGRVAVFDADGTLWYDDIGEAFFRWLIAEEKLPAVEPGTDPWADYEALCREDTGACYASLGPIMAGVAEADLRTWAADFFADQFAQKIFPAQRELIAQLQQAGWDVWIVTASNKWIVGAAAPALGLSPDRVIGIEVEVENGVLTDRQVNPVTYRQGKVEAIDKYIRRRPALVAGNSMTDYEMLAYASDLAIVINPKAHDDPARNLDKLAADAGWIVERW